MVFDPSAVQAERDYYQIADTLIQAFLNAKFPEGEEQDVQDHELEITETDSKGNTILLYGKDEDGRLVNRLSLDMVKNLQELNDAPVGAQIEGMPAVTVKVDGEVFLATDQDGIVVENRQSPALDAISSLEVGAYGLREQAEVQADVQTQPEANQSLETQQPEVSSSQSVDQESNDFKNQFDFLLSVPVGTDLPFGEITIKSGDQVIFQTDAQGMVISNQMFPDDQDTIEDFQLAPDLDLQAEVEAQFGQDEQVQIQAEASVSPEQEPSAEVRQQVEDLSFIPDMFVDNSVLPPEDDYYQDDYYQDDYDQDDSLPELPEDYYQDNFPPDDYEDDYYQPEATQRTAGQQQVDQMLDQAYETIAQPEDSVRTGGAPEPLPFEALVDLLGVNIQELVDRETYLEATKAILAQPEPEQEADPLGVFFEGFTPDQRAEIQAQAELQISQVPFEEPEASQSVSSPVSQTQQVSPQQPTQVEPVAVSATSNVQEPVTQPGNNQPDNNSSYRDDKPLDGLTAIAAALEPLPSSPTKDALLGVVANMQTAKQEQEKAPDPEMEAFVARRKEEPQNPRWWQKLSSTVESTFSNVRENFQNWRAATTLNQLAQSQALQSGESYEAAGYNLSREGNQYTLSDKEGNPKLRFEPTVFGVKVDKSLPPLSAGDLAKTQQLRADLDASKEPSGAFTQQAVHEGQYLSRVNTIVKALSDYAKSQGGNARVDGKLSYDFRSNAQGAVMISDKEGNVLLAAGNGHMRSRMEEKDLAHFEKMIPALSQSNSRAQAPAVASAPAVATSKKTKGLEL
jgi:hypothetical protein